MTTRALPGLLRSTLARVPVRGVPRLLQEISRFTLGDQPLMLRVAGGFALHVDPRDGDQCMMYYGLYGRGVLHAARTVLRPGDTAFDIGGQIGYLAASFAQLVGDTGRVVTFEPDPQVFARLQRCVEHNPELRITARDSALAAATGTAELHVSTTAGWSTLNGGVLDTATTVTVRTCALDDLLDDADLGWARLRLIKIDIEGGEWDALHGMRQVLGRHRPHVICELNPGCAAAAGRSTGDLLGLLADSGYRVRAIVMPGGLLRCGRPRLVDVASERDLPWSFGDVLCSPEEGA